MTGAALACGVLGRHLARPLAVDGPGLLDRGPSDAATDRSAGGSARLLPCRDGLVAVNLPRPADWALIPAWLGWRHGDDADWAGVAREVGDRPAAALADAGGELGLAVTPCPAPGAAPDDPQVRHRHPTGALVPWVLRGGPDGGRPGPGLRVVDLSALWAGPLLGALLARVGADVIKVEDPRRGDVCRARPTTLTRRLNRSKRLVTVPFDREGRDRLAGLLADADVVIESSRPRALDGLGVGPGHGLPAGQIWASITAHGRTGPWGGRVGYGDDTAAGGGLYRSDDRGVAFVGDAVADPLTGLHGAVAVLAALAGGWSGHIDLALRDTAATAGAVGR
jgi:hypothetical protein